MKKAPDFLVVAEDGGGVVVHHALPVLAVHIVEKLSGVFILLGGLAVLRQIGSDGFQGVVALETVSNDLPYEFRGLQGHVDSRQSAAAGADEMGGLQVQGPEKGNDLPGLLKPEVGGKFRKPVRGAVAQEVRANDAEAGGVALVGAIEHVRRGGVAVEEQERRSGALVGIMKPVPQIAKLRHLDSPFIEVILS